MKQTPVLLLGPDRGVISGVATHLNLLMGSALAERFQLEHFQVGSEGRREGPLGLAARMAASPFQLAAALARSGAEIVHVNTSLSAKAWWRDLAYVAVAKLYGARVVYQVHGGDARGFYRPLLRAALRWPDVVVVLAQCELEELRSLVQNVVLVPNAIDARPYLEQRRASAAPGAPLRLVHIGRLVASKGVFEMLEGLALARGQGVDARLVVAGDGPALEALRQAVHDLALDDRVELAGPVFGRRKAELLGEAEVLLFPTYHKEGLPYALLEGMAAGLVPVVTRVAAIPDVVTEGVHGFFVPARDPESIANILKTLYLDRSRLAHMSAACRERIAAAYSIERLAEDFTALYRRLETRTWAPSRAG